MRRRNLQKHHNNVRIMSHLFVNSSDGFIQLSLEGTQRHLRSPYAEQQKDCSTLTVPRQQSSAGRSWFEVYRNMQRDVLNLVTVLTWTKEAPTTRTDNTLQYSIPLSRYTVGRGPSPIHKCWVGHAAWRMRRRKWLTQGIFLGEAVG